ncbi:MAG: 50S ribosomal protein L32 [Candidatus Omnitrophica bacterium]|nr:50S ribosomal protein L32 [Candidatus Omnitrophota bacterium]
MPLPKRRHSKTRRDKSRTHIVLRDPPLSACAGCGALRVSHRICPHCGYYNGKKVLVIKTKETKQP